LRCLQHLRNCLGNKIFLWKYTTLLNTLKSQKFNPEREFKQKLAAHSADTLKTAGMVLVYYSSGINAKDTNNLRMSLNAINIRYFTRKSHADMFLNAHNHPMITNLLAGGGSVLLTSPDVMIKEVTQVASKFNNFHFMGGIVKNSKYPKQFILLGPAKLKEVLALPPQKDLVAQAVAQVLQTPQTLTSVLSTPSINIISLLQYYIQKKREDTQTANV